MEKEERLLDEVEDLLAFGPFKTGDLVTYHGKFYEIIPEGEVGRILHITGLDEARFARVEFNIGRSNCALKNLRRVKRSSSG